MSVKGSCLCGGITYEVDGGLETAVNCHCSMCRKVTGAAFRTRATVPAAAFRWRVGEDLVAGYESSPGETRTFCRRCGSTLATFFRDRPHEIGLPLGGLDDDPGIRPTAHVWVASKAPWFKITDGLPQFSEGFVAAPVAVPLTATPWNIRLFRIGDYADARALWDASEGIGLDDSDSRDRIEIFLDRNPGLSFVVQADGLLIGAVLCGHDGRRGLIYHLAVAAAHRHQGIGAALVGKCLAALREQGIRKCHIMVFGHNQPATGFWKRVGARERTDLILFSSNTEEAP